MAVLNEPVVTLEGVKILALHISSIDLELNLKVQNPNPFSATIRELLFTIVFKAGDKDTEIASGSTGRLELPAHGSTEINIPTTSSDLALIEALASIVTTGGIRLEIRGNAIIDHILVDWKLPFTKTVTISGNEIVRAVGKKIEGK